MTKQEFLNNWYVADTMPGFKADLDSVIQQAIAEHEAAQWKKYPEEKPLGYETGDWDGKRTGLYLIQDTKNVYRSARYYDYGNGEGEWYDYSDFEVYPIAFRELPAPYQEGGEG